MGFHKRIYGKHCTTVGELKAALTAIPDDMLLRADFENTLFATVLQDETNPEITYLSIDGGDGWNDWEAENREINATFLKERANKVLLAEVGITHTDGGDIPDAMRLLMFIENDWWIEQHGNRFEVVHMSEKSGCVETIASGSSRIAAIDAAIRATR